MRKKVLAHKIPIIILDHQSGSLFTGHCYKVNKRITQVMELVTAICK